MPNTKTTHTYFDDRKAHIDSFCYKLSETNWDKLYNSEDTDVKCDFFYDAFRKNMTSIPQFSVTKSDKDKAWITPLCKHLINLRWKYYRKKDYNL